jgi:hypothetical protein
MAPAMPMSSAHRRVVSHPECAAVNSQRFAVHECIRDLSAGGVNNARKRRTRYAHLFGSLRLLQPFEISQAKSLELLNCKNHFLQFTHRNAAWFEIVDAR